MNISNTALSLALALAAFSTGCREIEEITPNTITSANVDPGALSGACLNKDKLHGPHETTPFTEMVWHDEFNGRREDEDPSCYSRAPTCSSRQDWFGGEGPCPSDTNMAQLKDLNKCNWSLWSGYSFWGESKGTSFQNYHPNQIRLSNGNLILTTKVNRDLKELRCGWNPKSTWDKPDYQMLDCPITSGGLDSNPHPAPNAAGRNIRWGRIEVRAAVQNKVGTFPAIWMWSASTGPETAHPYLNTDEDFQKYPAAGEHDLFELKLEKSSSLEALQTYHSWGNEKIKKEKKRHAWQGASLPIKPDTFYRFGVERKPEGIYFYIDDCYTNFIPNGGKDKKKRTLYVNDLASFVMMNLTTMTDMISIDNFRRNSDGTWTRIKDGPLTGNFQQIDGAQMTIDYVRFFEAPTPINPSTSTKVIKRRTR